MISEQSVRCQLDAFDSTRLMKCHNCESYNAIHAFSALLVKLAAIQRPLLVATSASTSNVICYSV